MFNYPQLIVVFAVIVAALAGVPGERKERQVLTYSNFGAPLTYAASPYAYSAYSGVPSVSAYSAGVYPYAGVYSGAPAVAYY